MALETMKGIKEINGEPVEFTPDLYEYLSSSDKICGIVHDSNNSLYFKIQNGPIKENGKNGCQVEDVIAVAKHIIEQLNVKFPCRENAMIITKLDEAIMWSKKRTEDRKNRNVEGISEK